MNQDYLVEKSIGFDQIEAKYGISRRRIRRMMNSGLIFPSVAYHPLGGKTHGGKYLRHLFSKSDVLEIVIVSELLSQGFQLKKLEECLNLFDVIFTSYLAMSIRRMGERFGSGI